MNCDEAEKYISTGEPVGDELESHLDDCEGCRVLAEDNGLLETSLTSLAPETSFDSDSVFDEVEEQISEDEESMRARFFELQTGTRIRMLLSGGLLLSFVVLLAMPRPDFAVYPNGRMSLLLLGMAVFFVVTGYKVLEPLYRRARARWKDWLVYAGSLVVVVIPGVLPDAHRKLEVSLEGTGAALIPRAFKCFVFGTLVSTPIIGLIFLTNRMRNISLERALFAAASGGLIGNLALQLHCPIVHQEHILLGHSFVTLFLSGVAYLFYRRRSDSSVSTR